MNDLAHHLPHINASLNAIATVLLLTGYWLIKNRHEQAHQRVMLACFGVSTLFLISYITYHVAIEGSKSFPTDAADVVRAVYYFVLLTHIVLAMAVPPLAITTIILGLADRRDGHRRLAKWTFPIWLYVSITGVIVYAMLYHFFEK